MRKLAAAAILLIMLIGTAAGAEALVWYANEECANTSSWVNNTMASGTSRAYTAEVMYLGKYNDSSTLLPIELNRRLQDITGGILTTEFSVSFEKNMDDTSFCLLDGRTRAVSLAMYENGLYYEGTRGEKTLLCTIQTSENLDAFVYHIKLVIDLDHEVVKRIAVNGKTVLRDAPFQNTVCKIDSFNVRTGEQATGTFLIGYLKLYGGDGVYEPFYAAGIPDDFAYEGRVDLRTFHYRYQDRRSLRLNTEDGGASVEKSFDKITGKVNFETQILLPDFRTGVEAALYAGNQKILSVQVDETAFSCSGAKTANFYTYRSNVWYHLKATLDLKSNEADLYLNGKIKARNIPLNTDGFVDRVVITAEQSPYAVIIDDITVEQREEEPQDYVPEPKKVRSNQYSIGMQMCPLWTEGTFEKGWSAIKSAPGRKPCLGYYDEGNPEVSDWEIKQMTEHGIDFQLICAYTCYSSEISNRDPVKDTAIRHGNALHKGYFNAKYSDYMDFAILWENAGYKHGTQEYDDFFQNLVPFWIEYYFKDERYYRVNGRPFLSIYSPENFFALFGNTDLDIIAGIHKFRAMCVEAGVGDPILSVSPGGAYTAEKIALYNRYGIEGAAKYNFGADGIRTQRYYLNQWKQWNHGNAMQILPTCVSGFDSSPWNQKGGFCASGAQYENQLSWIKEEYMPSVPQDQLGNIIIAATWNEFGEGTYLCPTESSGYAYLDAIRNTFVEDGGVHEDVLPTEKQKKRVNQLTVQENFKERILEPVLPEVSNQKTVFSPEPDQWRIGGNIAHIAVDKGIMHIKPSGESPQIAYNNVLLDTDEINYIKIRMKPSSTAGDGYVAWTTTASEDADSAKRMYFSWLKEDGFNDIYVPVAKSCMWQGIVKELKIVLGTKVSSLEETIIVERIEFLGNEENNSNLLVDNCLFQARIENGFIALTDAAQALGGEIAHFTMDNSFTLAYQGTVYWLRQGTAVAESPSKSLLLDAAPVMQDERLYISIDALRQIFGVRAVEMDGMLQIRTAGAQIPNGIRDINYTYDLSDVGQMEFKDISSKKVENGILKITSNGSDPYIKLAPYVFEGKDIKRIVIGMKSDTGSTAKLYYQKDKDANFVYDQVMEFTLYQSGEICEYTLNTEQKKDFSGTIVRLRLDPLEEPGNVEFAYIRLLGDGSVPDIKIEDYGENYIKLTANNSIQYEIGNSGLQPSGDFMELLPGNYKFYWGFGGWNDPRWEIEATVGASSGRAAAIWNGTTDSSWYQEGLNEFVLDTGEKLAGFAELVSSGKDFKNKTVRLTRDINLNHMEFPAAGGNAKPFRGTFDGGGHIIRNLKSTNTEDHDFGWIARNEGVIKQIGIENAVLDARFGYCAGGLCGRNLGTIEACFVRDIQLANNSSEMKRMGGLAGTTNGLIKDSYSNNVSFIGAAPAYGFGFFTGTGENGAVCENCYAGAGSTADAENTRGFGAFSNDSAWSNCYFIKGDSNAKTVLNGAGAPAGRADLRRYLRAYGVSPSPGYNDALPVLGWELEGWAMPGDITASVIALTDRVAAVDVRNNLQSADSVVLVLAFYKQGVLTGVSIQEEAIPAQTTKEIRAEFTLKEEEVRGFLLKDLCSLKPITKAQRYNKEGIKQ